MEYVANESRYDNIEYNYSGYSGLRIPKLSLGLWHNFSAVDDYSNMVNMITTAFDAGITHFDLANNYGRPVGGSAETNFGKILKNELSKYRNELVISTKAGYDMWPGPYGDFGSRKYLMSSLDDSLKRMGLEYVDIFYHHRMDPDTPLEETMGALYDIQKSGKALYVGLSNYDAKTLKKASKILKSMGIQPLIHQIRFSMIDTRVMNNGTLKASHKEGMGTIAFSPLEQGVLSDKYINSIPEGSRAAKPDTFLTKDDITAELLHKVVKLNDIAKNRGQSLAQLAIAWLLGVGNVTSVLIGASSPEQIKENIKALSGTSFSNDEVKMIRKVLKDK